jgi:hypothetical protein
MNAVTLSHHVPCAWKRPLRQSSDGDVWKREKFLDPGTSMLYVE